MSDTKYDAMSKAATAAQERGDPATVRVHFPSEESGMIEDWSMCTPEMAALIEYGRRCRKQLRKKDEAAVWRSARRYRAKPTPKRAKAWLHAISARCGHCSSHIRTDMLMETTMVAPAEIFWPAFIEQWASCDAGSWRWSTILLRQFRRFRDTGKPATQFLDPADELQKKDLDFYSGLPNLVEVWRGADRRTLRCFSWTTNPAVAEFFAVHRRGH
jgi:hypothetical protein